MIILETKRYIYVAKCLDQKLSVLNLLANINHLSKVEKIIANKNNRMNYYEKKWQKYLAI